MENSVTSSSDKKELTIIRTFDAPRELVWKAWTDPDMIKQWWGPDHVTIPECEIDLKVGGKIYIVMEAGEAMGPYKGIRWPMLGAFTTVEPNVKLSYDAKAWTEGQNENGETMIDQTTEVTFTDEENGKTQLKLIAVIHKTGPGADMAVQGMQAGFTQHIEKLDTFLAGEK
jgi:uncharacterized protein YndB with AHSA1/START domain